MSGSKHKKRGGGFHLEDLEPNDDHNVQFVTPYYDETGIPEPLDLSKLCLDDDLFDKDDNNQTGNSPETRGRSRSRSVHENDICAKVFVPNSDALHGNSPDSRANNEDNTPKQPKKSTSPTGGSEGEKGTRKGGPLQHREVQALKKGLEEANQSLNKNQSREDEEERMAADAEKRKRLLLANNISNNSSAEATRRVKILMLGDSGVGKSSLILRWTLDTFSPSLVSTVGVNFKSRKVTISNELVQVQVWDTAGQEQFHKITTSYYKGAQGIMLVYDVTDPSSLANIEYWIKNIKSHASDTVQVALIGNKTDLRNHSSSAVTLKSVCDTERGEEIAHKFGIPFFETSAKESNNVDIAFLTLVEHIVENGNSGGNTVHSPNPGSSGHNNMNNNGLSHTNSGHNSNSNTTTTNTGTGVDKRSIVEKMEKSRLFNAFKRGNSLQNVKNGATSNTAATTTSLPPPPPISSSHSGTSTNTMSTTGCTNTTGAPGPSADDKEKCIIS